TALAQCPAVLHCGEQRVVEPLHRVAATRWRGMHRIAEAEPSGKGNCPPQGRPWYYPLGDGLIEVRRQRACRHVASPFRTAELTRPRRAGTPPLWADRSVCHRDP